MMSTSKEYKEFISQQLKDLCEITFKPMMGEYLIYYKGRLAGGIYDDTLLVKPVSSALKYMPEAKHAVPYPGAKPMLMVDNVDNVEYLRGLFEVIYEDLPVTEPRKRK